MKSHQLAVGAGEVEQETQIKWEVRALLGSIWTPAPSSGRPTLASQGRGGRRSREFSQLCVHGPGSRPARRRTLGKASAGPRRVQGVGLTIGRSAAVSVSATRDNKVSNRTSPFRP